MSRRYAKLGHLMSRCQRCDGDLIARSDGKIYCSETTCRHHKSPHKMGPTPSMKGARK